MAPSSRAFTRGSDNVCTPTSELSLCACACVRVCVFACWGTQGKEPRRVVCRHAVWCDVYACLCVRVCMCLLVLYVKKAQRRMGRHCARGPRVGRCGPQELHHNMRGGWARQEGAGHSSHRHPRPPHLHLNSNGSSNVNVALAVTCAKHNTVNPRSHLQDPTIKECEPNSRKLGKSVYRCCYSHHHPHMYATHHPSPSIGFGLVWAGITTTNRIAPAAPVPGKAALPPPPRCPPLPTSPTAAQCGGGPAARAAAGYGSARC